MPLKVNSGGPSLAKLFLLQVQQTVANGRSEKFDPSLLRAAFFVAKQ